MKNFEENSNVYTRALQIWQVLIAKADNRQTMTYGALVRKLGYTSPGAQFITQFLDPVMRYCQKNNLPPLTVLVVNQETGKPGTGLSTPDDIDHDRERVFNQDWFLIYPPTPEEFKESHETERVTDNNSINVFDGRVPPRDGNYRNS